jgi:hypothetical protein
MGITITDEIEKIIDYIISKENPILYEGVVRKENKTGQLDNMYQREFAKYKDEIESYIPEPNKKTAEIFDYTTAAIRHMMFVCGINTTQARDVIIDEQIMSQAVWEKYFAPEFKIKIEKTDRDFPEVNAGYKIILSETICNQTYVVGENFEAVSPYVIWNKDDRGYDCGRYFKEKNVAFEKLYELICRKAYYEKERFFKKTSYYNSVNSINTFLKTKERER